MKHRHLLLLCFLLAPALHTGAEGEPPPAGSAASPLTLRECVGIAVSHNPDVGAMLHAGRASMARIGQSRASYWPTLAATGGLSRSYAEAQSGTLGRSDAATSSSGILSTQVTLLDGGQRWTEVQGAEATHQAADWRFKATVQDLAVEVATAYYNLQGFFWDLEVAREILSQSTAHLEMARARESVGLAPRADVLRAATAEADARLGVVQAASDVSRGRSALAILMGHPADAPIEIAGVSREGSLPPVPDWADGRDRALSAIPEVRAARAEEEASLLSWKAARFSTRPTVTADGSVGLLDAGRWPDRDTWSVGLSVRIPLFTGFSKSWSVAGARAGYEGARAETRSALLAAEKAAYTARIGLEESLQAVGAAEAYLRSAEENAQVAEGQYREGLGSMLDLVDATASLQSAKLRLVRARLQALLSDLQWGRATGIDLLEGITVPSTSLTLSRKTGLAGTTTGDPTP
ncbi:MAG: TolC family protein [Acidobacteriota bacterium]